MTTGLRWGLPVLVLAVAAVVALWPRGADEDEPGQAPPASPAAGPSATADLAGARARAQLPACPSPRPGATPVRALRGTTAPCLADGRPTDLSTALAGHTTLVNVWATWCAPCRTELPVLSRYADRPGAARVLTVQTGTDKADGLDMLADLHVRLPAVYDGGHAVTRALDMPPALPASYVVGPRGRVRMVTDPRVFTSADQVAGAVRRYGAA